MRRCTPEEQVYNGVYAPPSLSIYGDPTWSPTCGPLALAAATTRPLEAVRDAVYADGYGTRLYMNPTHMKSALERLDIQF